MRTRIVVKALNLQWVEVDENKPKKRITEAIVEIDLCNLELEKGDMKAEIEKQITDNLDDRYRDACPEEITDWVFV